MDIESKLLEIGITPLDENAYTPLTPEEVAELEALLGASLPADYKAFVTKYGESHFSEIVDVRAIQSPPKHISDNELLDFSTFYGSNAAGNGLLAFVAILQGRMPRTMFPFARDHSGNSFCLCVNGTDRNKIYLWDHESEPAEEDYVERGLPVPNDLWYRNLTLVATSFTDFIGRLAKASKPD
jgi:hypothetical protein